ncbi:MAG: hypothetical protein LKJ22_08485 [Liquorilactobacillus nagelii]|uniref:hypothetical protein n=1 Tax=Liquorilactobacillus nagelii TaxID=82688 RepID=UPI0024307DC2|nr:hypothetical protein [Liquorilactobacillus nagelii]MCI1921943.1 hypothetical protein [Liquorilactobacillus nagelii]MCI1976409.1 hypothetical protein [Liquorilactobacillus nagelii]
MKKFSDYFKDAIAYGESLGLRNGTEERHAGFVVELDEPRTLERDGGSNFYPSFLMAWARTGICVDSLDPFKPEMSVEQQIQLVKMFISAYENYLADKKEPVAADSAE